MTSHFGHNHDLPVTQPIGDRKVQVAESLRDLGSVGYEAGSAVSSSSS